MAQRKVGVIVPGLLRLKGAAPLLRMGRVGFCGAGLREILRPPRLKGKSLKQSQKGYIEEDLEALSPGPVDWDANPDRTPLDLPTLFGGKPVWLEVGFGGGEHMVHQAAQNPVVGIIG